VIRYIAHRRPRTTVLAAGRLRRIVKRGYRLPQ
jgi:hypothetical protein